MCNSLMGGELCFQCCCKSLHEMNLIQRNVRNELRPLIMSDVFSFARCNCELAFAFTNLLKIKKQKLSFFCQF